MSNFVSKRIKSSITSRYQARPDKVFPMLCPVREYEWIEPWNCEVLHSDSGIAEKNCVFRTGFFGEPSKISLSEEPLSDVWVINHYEPNRRIEFVRMNSNRILFLSYVLADDGDGTTEAVIEQFLVGLTEQGNRSLDDIAGNFPFEFAMGEAMLNHYLTRGKMLPLKDAIEIASKKI